MRIEGSACLPEKNDTRCIFDIYLRIRWVLQREAESAARNTLLCKKHPDLSLLLEPLD